MKHTSSTQMSRLRRKARIRSRITGTAARPRLNVHRSIVGVYAQLIDDEQGKTLVAVSSKTADVKGVEVGERKGKIATAFAVGKLLAEKAKAQNIQTAVFDRGGFRYHGRVEAVADGAREGGLQF